MEERKQKILDFMSDDDYVPMKAKEIAMLMRVPKNEYHDFLEVIGELELELKIEKNRKNRYRISEKTYYDGYYRKNQKGFGFVRIEDREDEIYIAKENSLNALNGDHVLTEILEEENKIKRAEGRIVRILKHEKDTVVGTFQYNKNFGFVIPDDKNFGTDIFISKKNFGKARNNHKVLVKIIKYPESIPFNSNPNWFRRPYGAVGTVNQRASLAFVAKLILDRFGFTHITLDSIFDEIVTKHYRLWKLRYRDKKLCMPEATVEGLKADFPEDEQIQACNSLDEIFTVAGTPVGIGESPFFLDNLEKSW